jgi:F0F1-type ATP synthase delta subunit
MKQKYVSEILTKEKYSQEIVNFFRVLAENGRLNLTHKIINAFEDIIKAQRGQVDFKIVSAKVFSSLFSSFNIS